MPYSVTLNVTNYVTFLSQVMPDSVTNESMPAHLQTVDKQVGDDKIRQ